MGIELIKTLNDIPDHQTALRIEKLKPSEKEQLVDSMYTVKKLLAGDTNTPTAEDITYRYDVKPGDIGYIIYLHGLIYGNESIFSNEFEAYVIKTFYQFLEHCSMDKDRLWMAEYNNRIIGCIAIVHQTEEEAQLS